MGQNYKSKFDHEAWHADLKRKEEEQRQKAENIKNLCKDLEEWARKNSTCVRYSLDKKGD